MGKVMWIVLGGLVLHGMARAASFDCAKAQSKVEKMICADAELSKLDEDLAVAYAFALKESGKETDVRNAQKQWMKGRNDCVDVSCVKNAYAMQIKLIKVFFAKATEHTQQDDTIKGEFVSTFEATGSPICKLFTQNLNEFRHLTFNSCNPRLSPKFPEFSRPVWEEIPFDLGLAKKFIKGHYGRIESNPGMAQLAEKHWQRWLKGSRSMRQAGKAKMWHTQIDVDGDGQDETLIRITPNSAIVVGQEGEGELPYGCDYNLGELHMAEGSDQIMTDSFNGSGKVDIIKYAGDKRAFLVAWTTPSEFPRIEHDVGGTYVVILSTLGRNIGGPQCRIDWVPAKKQQPAKPQSNTK